MTCSRTYFAILLIFSSSGFDLDTDKASNIRSAKSAPDVCWSWERRRDDPSYNNCNTSEYFFWPQYLEWFIKLKPIILQ